MKTFKLLGVMALLVCAMTIVTGCNNKKDKSEPEVLYPSAESLVGTWKMISDPAPLEEIFNAAIMPGMMFYLGQTNLIRMGNSEFSATGEYSYNANSGKIILLGVNEGMDIEGILTKSSVENQVIWIFQEINLEFKKLSTENLLGYSMPE